MMTQQPEPQVQDAIEIASEALEEILYRALLGCEHGQDIGHELGLVLAAIDSALVTKCARPEDDVSAHQRLRRLVQGMRNVLVEAKSPELSHECD